MSKCMFFFQNITDCNAQAREQVHFGIIQMPPPPSLDRCLPHHCTSERWNRLILFPFAEFNENHMQ